MIHDDYEKKIQQLQKELEETKAENKKFREILNQNPRKDAFSDEVLERHPILLEVLGVRPPIQSPRSKKLNDDFTSTLSRLVRQSVFCYKTAGSSKNKSRPRLVRYQELSDDEYAVFQEAADEIMTLLEEKIEKINGKRADK